MVEQHWSKARPGPGSGQQTEESELAQARITSRQ